VDIKEIMKLDKQKYNWDKGAPNLGKEQRIERKARIV